MTINEQDRVHKAAEKIGTSIADTSNGLEWLPIVERMAQVIIEQQAQINALTTEVRQGHRKLPIETPEGRENVQS